MTAENIHSVYFVGAGGIGMSALVRYFLSQGVHVAGYDRTTSSSQNNSAGREPASTMKTIPLSFRTPAATHITLW